MQEFIKKHNTGIFVGLISTMIFIYLLQPILEFVGNSVVNIGSYIGATYVDKIFSQVSHLELMDFGFFFFAVMSLVLTAFVSLSVILVWKKDKAKSENEDKPKERKASFIYNKILVTFILFVIFTIFVTSISTKAYQLSLITSFKQHLRIVSPYITTQEEKKILSNWSLIRTKEDYELVYSQLESIAAKQNLELPDNAIYALDSL